MQHKTKMALDRSFFTPNANGDDQEKRDDTLPGKRVEMANRTYLCVVCGLSFTRNSALIEHSVSPSQPILLEHLLMLSPSRNHIKRDSVRRLVVSCSFSFADSVHRSVSSSESGRSSPDSTGEANGEADASDFLS